MRRKLRIGINNSNKDHRKDRESKRSIVFYGHMRKEDRRKYMSRKHSLFDPLRSMLDIKWVGYISQRITIERVKCETSTIT